MAAPTPAVSVYLPTSTAVTSAVNWCRIQRGRTSPIFEDFNAGTAEFQLNNEDRDFDPLHASSPYFGEVVPGRRVSITAGGVSIFDGRVADWNYSYDVSNRSVAQAECEDDLAKLARAEFDEWTTTRGELPGARITSALARPEVDYDGTPSLDDGIFPLTDELVSYGSNVLNYLQLVARTDQGLLFVDRSGVLTFLDRHHFINVASAATFGTGGIGFASLQPSYGREQLFNRVSIERQANPNEDEELVEPQIVSDSTSVTAYNGTFTLAEDGLLMQDDTTALDLANYLLSIYKDPLFRFEAVTVNVHGLSGAQQTTVLGLDIGSVVTVVFTPNGVGSAISRTCVVEGIRHEMSPRFHEMTFTLNDAAVQQTGEYWQIGDATYGKVGTGGYPIAF